MNVALTLTNNLVATFHIGHWSVFSLLPLSIIIFSSNLNLIRTLLYFSPDDTLDADPRCATTFYTGDWRSSELSPQGHSLYSIACEMLASPFDNRVLGRAFINILYQE